MRGVPGVDEGGFVRYPNPQGGGNIRPDHPNVVSGRWKPGINADEAIFMPSFDAFRGATISNQQAAKSFGDLWSKASVRSRLDAVASHELAELQAVQPANWDVAKYGPWNPHKHAIRFAPDTTLKISDQARELLRLQRQALGLD
jgi:hypothetical protein